MSTLALPPASTTDGEALERVLDAEPIVHRARHRRQAGSANPLRGTLLIAGGFAVLAALLRLVNISTSYNLFIDEATYAAIARDSNLATGPLLNGAPFLLHPPLALMAMAGAAHLVGTQDIAALVTAIRPFVAIVGALTVAVIYATLDRAGLRRSALVAATFVALDPFIISFDSRVMLESFAQLSAALTIAAAIRTTTAAAERQWLWVTLTAVAGAATFGSKETFGLVILASLLLAAASSPREHRRPLLISAAGALVGYGLVNLAMIHWGGLAVWWQMRTAGLARLIGTHQPTGIKSAGSHDSLLERILPGGAVLAGSYALLVIGGLCALTLLWPLIRHRSAVRTLTPAALGATRIVSAWAVCACVYAVYAMAFGSLEEQMFYIAATPCATALAIRMFLVGRAAVQRSAAAVTALIVLSQGVAWGYTHTHRDDVYDQMLSRISDVAAPGSSIAMTEETGQFVLTGYDLDQWRTAHEVVENHVDYVLLSNRLVRQGYGLADQEFANEVRANGTLALSIHGRDSDLELYDVRAWTEATS